jgi:hypothetical protein
MIVFLFSPFHQRRRSIMAHMQKRAGLIALAAMFSVAVPAVAQNQPAPTSETAKSDKGVTKKPHKPAITPKRHKKPVKAKPADKK